MDRRRDATVVGVAVTTFLVVGAATIEAVTAAVGGDVGPGILGVIAGAVGGLVAPWAVARRWERLDRRARAVLAGYAAFGLALLSLAALGYVDAPGADAVLTFWRTLVIAGVAAVAAAAWAAATD